MSRYQLINNLLNKVIEKDEEFVYQVQTHWDKTDRFYKNDISIEHFTKLYILVVNHSAVLNLFYQSIKKELKGVTHA
ncbi:hypothetical protein [Rickettsiella endosymbiont of Dermanyssus gallinae]|uniref:hypothetical protein n=1 Tax=Rickettsiella endosymbiont of Dermanyssus gallinae TaxID=2856608 RepID=UPI001C5283B5|nr:hypothetical protein [Rickettsiella endosymbiont of Dermanyssus gallinae]